MMQRAANTLNVSSTWPQARAKAQGLCSSAHERLRYKQNEWCALNIRGLEGVSKHQDFCFGKQSVSQIRGQRQPPWLERAHRASITEQTKNNQNLM
jgi:hypothetical protein